MPIVLDNVANEYSMTQAIQSLDRDTIMSIIDDQIENPPSEFMPIPNLVQSIYLSYEQFKTQYPYDSQNLNQIAEDIYYEIIDKICRSFDLQFNTMDESINRYTAAYYLYEFCISNRTNNIINFFVNYIINNKDGIIHMLKNSDSIKQKSYKLMYGGDEDYILIANNIVKILESASTMQITLSDIYMTSYADISIAQFMDIAFADKADFFHNHFYALVKDPSKRPVIITGIQLMLQQVIAGDISNGDVIQALINQNNS